MIKKNRKDFLQTTALGLFGSIFLSVPESIQANNSGKVQNKAVVKNSVEGETYFVRENTPITIRLSKKTDGIDTISVCTEEMLQGGGIPVHKHLYADEMFFFQQGTGIFILDSQEVPVAGGSTAFVPRGTWHGLKNTGKELLVFTFGYTPAGFEDFFRQIGTLKGFTFKAKTPEEVKTLAEQYGMVYK